MGWRDTIKKEASKTDESPKSWRDSIKKPEEKTSSLESSIRGGVQGFPFIGSYADEATGALESAFTDKSYAQARDESRANYKKAADDNPVEYNAANLGMAVLGDIPKAVPLLGQAYGTAEGAIYGLGASEADLTKGEYGQAAKDTAISGAIGLAPKVLGKGYKLAKSGLGRKAVEEGTEVVERAVGRQGLKTVGSDVVSSVDDLPPEALKPAYKTAEEPKSKLDTVVNWMKNKSNKLAENATGATAVQSEKFADNAGAELKKRGIVKFGNDPGNIASKAGAKMDEARGEINKSLTALDDKGAFVTKEEILASMQQEVARLRKSSAKGDVVRKVEEIMGDIEAGPDKMKLFDAESIKRDWQAKVNYDTPMESQEAYRIAASAHQKPVERVALEMDPSLADTFMKGKESYGLLSPIEKASARRAKQLDQSPFGGLLDTAAMGVGGAMFGYGASQDPFTALTTGVGTAFTRRQIAPRVTSSAAVVMDKSADFLSKLGSKSQNLPPKYQTALQNAAQKGGNHAAITHFLLSSQDPEYKKYFEEEK